MKIGLFIIMFLVEMPIRCFADIYGIYDDSESYGSGSMGIFDFIVLIASVIFSFWFLSRSYNEWKIRRKTGKKVERSDFVADIVAPFFGYALVSFFLSVPFLFAMKLLGGVAAVKEYWFSIGIVCFGVVAWLRQT